MSRPEWIEVGRVSRPHGVRGEVRVSPGSDNPERFSKGSVLHARPGGQGILVSRGAGRRTLTVGAVRGEADYPIVSFEEIPGRKEAEGIRGYVLEVPLSELPPLDEGEFYPFDLVGLSVRDLRGGTVGVVAEIIDSPAHPILAVKADSGQETLVPFVEAVVTEVLLEEGYLVVADGFLSQTTEAGNEGVAEREVRGQGTKGRS